MNFYEGIILPENLEKDFFLMEYIISRLCITIS